MMASQAVLKAVTSGRLTQTRLLVQMGSDVNGRDVKGQTPLIHALFVPDAKVRTSFLRLLLKAGAVVSLTDSKKWNALMWACRLTTSDDVRLLLRYADIDLDINAQNLEGQTGLWIAVNSGRVESVRELLQALSKHELSSEVDDHWGVTPAMRAAALGHLDCLQALITHLDTTTKSNNTLLNIAKINQILKAISISSEPEKKPGSPHAENPENKTTITPKLPTIQIINNGYKSAKSALTEPQQNQQNNNALFSLEFLRDPTRCSTPMSFTRREAKSCPRPQRSGQVSPIPFDSADPNLIHSFHLPDREGAVTPDMKSASYVKAGVVVRFENQRHRNHDPWRSKGGKLSVMAPSHSAAPVLTGSTGGRLLSGPIGGSTLPDAVRGHGGRVGFRPVGSMVVVRGSVRDSLPGLFDLMGEQTCTSFRKAAVIPPPKIVRPRGASWVKLRGLTLLGGGLSKGEGGKGKGKTKRKLTMVKQKDG